MKRLLFAGLLVLFLQGCSSGTLRAFNDALSEQNGYTVTYPDQSDTDYVGDIKWVTGVKNGDGFQRITNTGSDYCKVRVKFEDDSYRYFYLEPSESTGSMYVSIYNQETSMDTLCSPSERVYNSLFDD